MSGEPRLTYRDFLIQQIVATIGALAEGIQQSILMRDEEYAVSYLEHRAAAARTLLQGKPNPDRVEPRLEAEN